MKPMTIFTGSGFTSNTIWASQISKSQPLVIPVDAIWGSYQLETVWWTRACWFLAGADMFKQLWTWYSYFKLWYVVYMMCNFNSFHLQASISVVLNNFFMYFFVGRIIPSGPSSDQYNPKNTWHKWIWTTSRIQLFATWILFEMQKCSGYKMGAPKS